MGGVHHSTHDGKETHSRDNNILENRNLFAIAIESPSLESLFCRSVERTCQIIAMAADCRRLNYLHGFYTEYVIYQYNHQSLGL